jgi:hypothetical protein
LSRDIKTNELLWQAIGVNSVIKALRREAVEPLLLVPTECIQGNMVPISPRLNLCKERSKITTLYTKVGGDLSGRQ